MDVDNKVDLTINKTVNKQCPNIGDTIIYTITVTNNGQNNATGVTIMDKLPDGLLFLNTTNGIYNSETKEITWTVNNLNSGTSIMLNITVIVNKMWDIVNCAMVTSDQDDSCKNDSVTVFVPEVDLSHAIDLAIVKEVSNLRPSLGECVTYTITVSNNGPGDASGVVVTNKLPNGLVFVNSSHCGCVDSLYDPVSGIWEVGFLASGRTVRLNILVVVNRTGDIVNCAMVTSDQDDSGKIDSVAVFVPEVDLSQAIDLAIVKEVSNLRPSLGECVTYTIAVSNNGPGDASGVVVTDKLPIGLIFVNSSHCGCVIGLYDLVNGIWEVGFLALGHTVKLNIIVIVNDIGAITNYANVSGNEQETNLSNNYANITITIQTENNNTNNNSNEEKETNDSDEKEEIYLVNVPEPENLQVPENETDLPSVVLDETDDSFEIIEDEPNNDTETDVNTTITSTHSVLMQKTALPIALLILVILSIFGLISIKGRKI